MLNDKMGKLPTHACGLNVLGSVPLLTFPGPLVLLSCVNEPPPGRLPSPPTGLSQLPVQSGCRVPSLPCPPLMVSPLRGGLGVDLRLLAMDVPVDLGQAEDSRATELEMSSQSRVLYRGVRLPQQLKCQVRTKHSGAQRRWRGTSGKPLQLRQALVCQGGEPLRVGMKAKARFQDNSLSTGRGMQVHGPGAAARGDKEGGEGATHSGVIHPPPHPGRLLGFLGRTQCPGQGWT